MPSRLGNEDCDGIVLFPASLGKGGSAAAGRALDSAERRIEVRPKPIGDSGIEAVIDER